MAASLHDIGKIGVPDHILLETGKLNDSERTVMELHTLIGPEIIGKDDSDLLSMARSIALTHHERWDGGGYPMRLAGAAIPLEGRIVAICDTFDTLTSSSSSRRTLTIEEASQHIVNESGKAFDPDLVAVFERLLPHFVLIHDANADPVRTMAHPPAGAPLAEQASD